MRSRLLFLIVCATGLVVGAATATSAAANVTKHLTVVRIVEDGFWNYDFNPEGMIAKPGDARAHPDHVASDNVDWPVNLVFYDNATYEKIRAGYETQGYDRSGAAKWEYVNDGTGTGWEWVSSGGRKKTKCPRQGSTPHMRMYGAAGYGVPYTDRLYNTHIGYYMIATSHWDYRECGFFYKGRYSGLPESAEHVFALAAMRIWGTAAVREDRAPFGNGEETTRLVTPARTWYQKSVGYWPLASYYEKSEGGATMVQIP